MKYKQTWGSTDRKNVFTCLVKMVQSVLLHLPASLPTIPFDPQPSPFPFHVLGLLCPCSQSSPKAFFHHLVPICTYSYLNTHISCLVAKVGTWGRTSNICLSEHLWPHGLHFMAFTLDSIPSVVINFLKCRGGLCDSLYTYRQFMWDLIISLYWHSLDSEPNPP